jgi:hypothetical protein
MAIEYRDDPPQFFKPNIPNNSPDVQGYFVTVTDDGATNIFKKDKDGNLSAVGKIAKGGGFSADALGQFSNQATQAEKDYFTANARKTVTDQAVPVVRRGVGGSAGGGNAKINEVLGTNLASPPANPLPGPSPLTSDTISADFERTNFGDSNNLRYPAKLDITQQDCIQFSMETNEGRSLVPISGNSSPFAGLGARNPPTTINGTVTLPIQSGITDSNGVEWGGANLDAKDAYLARLALGGITSDKGLGDNAGNLLGKVFKDLKDAAGKSDFKNAFNLYLAQEAVGVQGLLSRASGAILNPNLELLFNGPTLRSFSFTFRLSPRSKEEASNVRRIIRYFKEGMSVKTAADGVFLKSPNIFKIKYIPAGPAPAAGAEAPFHKSLPRIKKCALLGCDVDYTPDGTYMTFNDEAKTMTSYQLSLRFSELDPLYSDDYKDIELDEIGY